MPNFPLNRLEKHFSEVLIYFPGMMGNMAVNFFIDSFNRQGWMGHYLEPWVKRKAKRDKRPGRAILVDSARLKRSIRIIRIGIAEAEVGTDVPYAKAHNEGFRGLVTVKAHTRNRYSSSKVGTGKLTSSGKERLKTVHAVSGSVNVPQFTRKMNLPKRQFMGYSPILENQIKRQLTANLLKAYRKI